MPSIYRRDLEKLLSKNILYVSDLCTYIMNVKYYDK